MNSKTVYQQLIENLLETTRCNILVIFYHLTHNTVDKAELDIVTRQFQSMKPFVPQTTQGQTNAVPANAAAAAAAQTSQANPLAAANNAQAAAGQPGANNINQQSNAGGKVISTAEANAITALQERVDRQKFRDMLSQKFGMTESLIMDRGKLIVSLYDFYTFAIDNSVSSDGYRQR